MNHVSLVGAVGQYGAVWVSAVPRLFPVAASAGVPSGVSSSTGVAAAASEGPLGTHHVDGGVKR